MVAEKLGVVTNRGRRKLSMVTDRAQLGVVTENLNVVTEVRECDSRDIYIYELNTRDVQTRYSRS